MPKEQIWIVEDEEEIRELIRYNLVREGYGTKEFSTGEKFLEKLNGSRPDLVLLDLMLPGVDGLEICRRLKGKPDTASIPVVMVTAKGEESDVVAGLELGAEDYVTKPFRPKVLVARVRNVLRRRGGQTPVEEATLRLGDLAVDPGRFEVRVKGKPVELTRTEFRILHFLARRPGWVFTRYQIVDGVQGKDYPVTDRSVDVHVVGLRRKLGPFGKRIETVRGVGYRMKEE